MTFTPDNAMPKRLNGRGCLLTSCVESPHERGEYGDEPLGSVAFIAADNANCLYEPRLDAAVRMAPPYGSEVHVVRDEGPWVLIKMWGKEAWSPRGNLSTILEPRRPAVEVGLTLVRTLDYRFRTPTTFSWPVSPPLVKVEVGPRGGRFVRTAKGFRRYL